MKDNLLTMGKLKSHIKRGLKRNNGQVLGLLGLVENKDLTPEVESLFTFYRNGIPCGYDWVNGNDKLRELINTIRV